MCVCACRHGLPAGRRLTTTGGPLPLLLLLLYEQNRANRASGEALTEALVQEVTAVFKVARPGELQLPEYFARDARRLVEDFKVKIMGTAVPNRNPDSKQQHVVKQTAEHVSLGMLHGVEIKVRVIDGWGVSVVPTRLCV